MDKKKVLLGMSGGVDSTASVIILQNKGYEVIGATYRLTDDPDFEKNIQDAKNAAKKLNIEHIVVDYRRDFKNHVITNFVNEYMVGHTPNPCVVCNKFIKYGDFLKTATDMGIWYISSGQYAKIDEIKGKKYVVKPANEKKDQTYFIYNLHEEMLDRIVFPMGEIESKDDTRQIVKDAGIEIYSKKDSQEICFIKDISYKEYITNNNKALLKTGSFINKKGDILGSHEGILNYTIGQRKGLGITLGKPTFVIDIDYEKNNVMLGDNEDLFKDELILDNINFINEEYNKNEQCLTAKIRYAAKEEPVSLIKNNNHYYVKFINKVRAITKGQSIVFYDKNILVGGGII